MERDLDDIMNEYGCIEINYDDDDDDDEDGNAFAPQSVKGLWAEDDQDEDEDYV